MNRPGPARPNPTCPAMTRLTGYFSSNSKDAIFKFGQKSVIGFKIFVSNY